MLILSYLVIIIKHVLQGFCVCPSQLLNVIRGGMLLCEVPTRNSAPIPSSTRNMNLKLVQLNGKRKHINGWSVLLAIHMTVLSAMKK